MPIINFNQRNPLFKKKGESKFYRAKEKAVCEEKRQTIYHFLAPPNRQSKKQKIPSDKTVPIDINKQSHHHQETQMKSPTAKVDKTKMIEDIEQLISEIQSQTPKPVTTGECVQMPGTGKDNLRNQFASIEKSVCLKANLDLI